jgi:hypothetical protein
MRSQGFPVNAAAIAALVLVSSGPACLAEGGGASPSPEPDAAKCGTLSASLGSDSLAIRLGLESAASFFKVGLESDGDGAAFSACLDLAGAKNGGPRLVAGPGSISGSLRLLVDPTSTSALESGPPVIADRSLASRKAVLGLGAGPLSLFSIAEGDGAFAFATKGGGPARGLGPAAGGFSLRELVSPSFALEALAAASFGAEAGSATGWKPDPGAFPALPSSEGERPLASFALLAERLGDTGSARFALASSYGDVAGTGLALRLESRMRDGPLDLGLCAAAASPRFRGLFGERQERLLGAELRSRLALRRASSLTASVAAEAVGRGERYAPLWGHGAALALRIPVGSDQGLSVDAGLEGKRPAVGEGKGSFSLSFRREKDRAAGSESARLGACLRWGQLFSGLEIGLSTRVEGRENLPSLGLDLALALFEGGSADSPVVAKGKTSLALPCGRRGSLSLVLSLPEKGVVLAPLGPESGHGCPSLGLRYKASIGPFPASRKSRPRSRMSAAPKASSIAQRAAS